MAKVLLVQEAVRVNQPYAISLSLLTNVRDKKAWLCEPGFLVRQVDITNQLLHADLDRYLPET